MCQENNGIENNFDDSAIIRDKAYKYKLSSYRFIGVVSYSQL